VIGPFDGELPGPIGEELPFDGEPSFPGELEPCDGEPLFPGELEPWDGEPLFPGELEPCELPGDNPPCEGEDEPGKDPWAGVPLTHPQADFREAAKLTSLKQGEANSGYGSVDEAQTHVSPLAPHTPFGCD